MSFTRSKSGLIIYKCIIDLKSLTRVTIIKDLEVPFDQKLDFIQHIEQIVAKAYGMLAFVIVVDQRSLMTRIITKFLFCCLVSPMLEHVSENLCYFSDFW